MMMIRIYRPGTGRGAFPLLHYALIAVLAMAGLAPLSGASAETAFEQDLKAQNAKHIREAFPFSRPSGGSMIDSGAAGEDEKGPWGMRLGNLSLLVEMKRTAPIDMSAFPVPVLTVSVDGRQVIVSEGSQGQPDFASFTVQLVEMDKGNPHPEIVFSSYTGGAHCCSDTRVLTSDKSGKTWKEIQAGAFDGGPVTAADMDSDGRYELVVRDNRFLYRFGCYACSAAPLQMLRLQGGRLIDASSAKSFRATHQSWLVRLIDFSSDGSDPNGFLAGYVAAKIRLGEGKQAWAFLQKYYDRKSDWGLEHCEGKQDKEGKCLGKEVKLSFPDALKRFLEATGYPLPN